MTVTGHAIFAQLSEPGSTRCWHAMRRCLCALLFTAALVSGCSSGSKKSATPDASRAGATPIATPALSAQQLADEAVRTTDALTSFHFVLSHENGTTPIASGISMRRAEGDFLKPDRFKATVNGTVGGGFAADVKVINVGDQVWLNLTGTRYTPLANGVGAATILDPNNGVLKAIKGVRTPVIAGSDTINGVATTIVAGTIDAGDLTALDQTVQAGKPADGKVWIGNADHRVYRLRIDGPLNDQEPANIARIIDLSQFDETLDIQPPP